MLKVVNQFHIGKETSSIVSQSDAGLAATRRRPLLALDWEGGILERNVATEATMSPRTGCQEIPWHGRAGAAVTAAVRRWMEPMDRVSPPVPCIFERGALSWIVV